MHREDMMAHPVFIYFHKKYLYYVQRVRMYRKLYVFNILASTAPVYFHVKILLTVSFFVLILLL